MHPALMPMQQDYILEKLDELKAGVA
jgi:hypothetical protein